MVTGLEKANLLAPLNVMFSHVFVTFPCGVLGQVWYLIVYISDLCLLPYQTPEDGATRPGTEYLQVDIQHGNFLEKSISSS